VVDAVCGGTYRHPVRFDFGKVSLLWGKTFDTLTHEPATVAKFHNVMSAFLHCRDNFGKKIMFCKLNIT
jgi:hypothetical protein